MDLNSVIDLDSLFGGIGVDGYFEEQVGDSVIKSHDIHNVGQHGEAFTGLISESVSDEEASRKDIQHPSHPLLRHQGGNAEQRRTESSYYVLDAGCISDKS
jgi:hypothetical protein